MARAARSITPRAELSLPARKTIRPGDLAAALGAVVAHAVAQVERARTEPTVAVHEYRKAMRRARSVVRFITPVADERRIDALAASLRAAHRAASRLRDADVLATTAPELAPRRPVDAARVQRLLGDQGRRLAGADKQLARALPGALDPDDLADLLRRSYRRVRRAARLAADTRAPDDVHALRRRTKELTHALELLAALPAFRTGAAHRRFGRLSQHLGQVTDLQLVQGARPAVAATLAPRREPLLDRALAEAARAAKARPRAFVNRVVR